MISSLPFQRKLPLDAEARASFKVPLIEISAVRSTHATADGEVIREAIEAGEIGWAFDIRRENSADKALRVFAHAATAWSDRREFKATFDAVMEAIWPEKRQRMTSVELARRLSCTPTHVLNLIADGSLSVHGQQYRSNEARLVIRESVKVFLERRAL